MIFIMTDVYAYLQEVLTLIIPIAIGAGTTRWIVNAWQTTKDTFELKKQILTDFQKSFISEYSLMADLVTLVREYYTESIKWNESTKDEERKIKFPSKEDKPLIKFSTEYDEYRKKRQKAYYREWNFYGTEQLYHRDTDLKGKLEELNKKGGYCEVLLEMFMRSETEEEFNKNYTAFHVEFQNMREKLHAFRDILVRSKISLPRNNLVQSPFGKIHPNKSKDSTDEKDVSKEKIT
jgi:hypothetical protein